MALANVSRYSRASGRLAASALILTSLAASSLIFIAPPAHADDTSYGGDSRILGMGGAGIALPPDLNGGMGRVNPASLAFEKKGTSLSGPGLGFRSNHADVNKVASYFINGSSTSNVASLARDFDKQDSDFGTNGDVGIRINHLEIAGSGVGIGRILPNASLTSWARSNGSVDQVPFDAKADVYGGAIYNLPAVSYAVTVPQAQTATHDLAMGARLKYMQGVYTHYIASVDTIRGLRGADLASEMNGSNSLSKQGMGMDFGLMMRPHSRSGVSLALVATNVIASDLTFNGTDRNGNPHRYNLVASTLSLGSAYQHKGTTLATDLADIGSNTQLRMGVEHRFSKIIALRGGYNSGTGFTAGIGIAGFGFAYAQRMPLEVARTIRF